MHFKISGKDFTRMARERLLDDNPGAAWRLASCLLSDDSADRAVGVNDIALGILTGAKKLVGNESDMRAVEDTTAAKYREQLDYLFAGRIRIQGMWYRPAAFVSNMGRKDVAGRPHWNREGSEDHDNRAKHYCGPDEIVAEFATYPDREFPSVGRAVIFQRCNERPHWMDVPSSPQMALDQFLAAGHRLEERSHSSWYGDFTEDVKTTADNQAISSHSEAVAKDRAYREVQELKEGNLGPMNARLNAEEDLLNETTDDPRTEFLRLARKQGPGVSTMAEMLLEYDPTALDRMQPTTPIESREMILRRQIREAEKAGDQPTLDRLYAEEDVLRAERIAELRVQILQQAGTDLIALHWDDVTDKMPDVVATTNTVQIPRAPFLHWAFARMRMFDEYLPPWTPVSPIGLKMTMDDPFHSDWVIGAGLDPNDRGLLYYPGPVNEAALKLAHELQDTFDEPSHIHVLVDGPHAFGTVHHGKPGKPCPAGSIVVLPNLSPKYAETVADAVAVITEAGGMTAHLAQVGREQNLPIVRVGDARERYPEGITLVVDTSTRTVKGI